MLFLAYWYGRFCGWVGRGLDRLAAAVSGSRTSLVGYVWEPCGSCMMCQGHLGQGCAAWERVADNIQARYGVGAHMDWLFNDGVIGGERVAPEVAASSEWLWVEDEFLALSHEMLSESEVAEILADQDHLMRAEIERDRDAAIAAFYHLVFGEMDGDIEPLLRASAALEVATEILRLADEDTVEAYAQEVASLMLFGDFSLSDAVVYAVGPRL
jgi:hypothetical protein